MIHAISERGLTAISGSLSNRRRPYGPNLHCADWRLSFKSPASWFNSYGWDVSPGYGRTALIDFDRPLDETCLFCHAGPIRFADDDGHRLKTATITSITCDRCHGPPEAHVRHPSGKNIVNPAKLRGGARDGVCEQCHLEGATRVLNPGKSWEDFHAGQTAETTYATYLLAGGDNADTVAVSQVEQLAQSKCARASGGKLWCGTCHQPHGEIVDRQRQIRAVCTSCHATLSAASHPANQLECTSCHMPRRSTTDISHAAS